MPCLSAFVMAILPRESLAEEGRALAIINDRVDIVSCGKGLSDTSSVRIFFFFL